MPALPKGASVKEQYRTVLLSNLAPTDREELEVSVKALVHSFRVGGITRISCPADARSTKKLSTRAFIVFSTLERAGRAVAALDGYRLVLSTGTDFKAGKAGTLLKAKFLQQLSSSAAAEDGTMTAGGLLMLSSDGASWSFTTDVNPPADVRPVTDVVPDPVAWPCPPPVSSLPELRPMLSRWADAVEEEDIDDAASTVSTTSTAASRSLSTASTCTAVCSYCNKVGHSARGPGQAVVCPALRLKKEHEAALTAPSEAALGALARLSMAEREAREAKAFDKKVERYLRRRDVESGDWVTVSGTTSVSHHID